MVREVRPGSLGNTYRRQTGNDRMITIPDQYHIAVMHFHQ